MGELDDDGSEGTDRKVFGSEVWERWNEPGGGIGHVKRAFGDGILVGVGWDCVFYRNVIFDWLLTCIWHLNIVIWVGFGVMHIFS